LPTLGIQVGMEATDYMAIDAENNGGNRGVPLANQRAEYRQPWIIWLVASNSPRRLRFPACHLWAFHKAPMLVEAEILTLSNETPSVSLSQATTRVVWSSMIPGLPDCYYYGRLDHVRPCLGKEREHLDIIQHQSRFLHHQVRSTPRIPWTRYITVAATEEGSRRWQDTRSCAQAGPAIVQRLAGNSEPDKSVRKESLGDRPRPIDQSPGQPFAWGISGSCWARRDIPLGVGNFRQGHGCPSSSWVHAVADMEIQGLVGMGGAGRTTKGYSASES